MDNKPYKLNLPTTNLSGKYIYSVYVGNDLLTDSITLTNNFDESRKKIFKRDFANNIEMEGFKYIRECSKE